MPEGSSSTRFDNHSRPKNPSSPSHD